MIKKNYSLENKSRQRCFSLTTRGLNQANRNDSSEIWNLLSTGIDFDITGDYQNLNINQKQIYQENSKRIQQSIQQHNKVFIKSNLIQDKSTDNKKRILLNNNNKNQQTKKQMKTEKDNKIKQNKKQNKQQSNRSKHIIKKQNNNLKPLSKINNQERIKKEQTKKNILLFTPQQIIKKMNPEKLQWIINEYIQSQKFFTRTMPNTAFAKIFSKPCQQTYGYKNCSNQSCQTNNTYKTFNVVPHTKQNNPKTYQSYQTSLKYAKRCKLNEQKQKYKIQLQLAKKIKFQQLQRLIKKYQRNTQQNQIKSKSLGKYQEKNQSQINEQEKNHPKVFDLDDNFNKRYFQKVKQVSNYLMKRNPILPQQVNRGQIDLDQIKRQNHQNQKIQGPFSHYLISCVDTPYDRSKYSFRQSRVSSIKQKV